MSAAILPSNAAYQEIAWSVEAGTATATINSGGLLSPAANNGTVIVKATALDGSGVYGTLEITISGQVAVSSVTVTAEGGATTITDNAARTLQMYAKVLPAEVSDKSVNWSISSNNDTDTATISSDGLLTAIRNGKVTVRATSKDAIHYGELEISISNMIVPVATVSITNADLTITTNNGSLQLTASVLPADAANQNIIWSISSSDADTASISSTGLLTAIRNGKVTVRATAADGSGVFAEQEITISNQIVEVTGISLNGSNITVGDGTSTITATIFPADATEQGVTWSVSDETIATISTTGILTAITNGSVTVTGTTKENGSTVKGEITITITGQVVRVTSITLAGSNITTVGETSTITPTIFPADATEQGVTWSVSDEAIATISTKGVLTAITNGTVTVTAITKESGSVVKGEITITITGQSSSITEVTGSNIVLYPNPVVNELYIDNTALVSTVNIYELNGRLIKSIRNTGESKMTINTSSFVSGMYVVSLCEKDGSIIRQKFIKE
jgi:uncharacterized protein YjdB